jgi:hypothetical protein
MVIEEGMVADIIHLCDFSISSQFVYVFSSSVVLHSCYRYRLTMDESKSETTVRYCAECVVVRYIFRAMYGKIVFDEMDNKSISVNGSRCLISYVNIVVLIIKYYTQQHPPPPPPLFQSVVL